MAITTKALHAPGNDTYYDRLLLERMLPVMAHEKWGQKRPIKLHSGGTAKFRRIERLSAVPTPLTDGTDVTAVVPTITDITCTIHEYGNAIEYTRLADETNQDALLTEYTELLGENLADTLDIVCRNVINAGTSVRYANGVAARGNVTTLITTTDLDVAIRSLELQNAKKHTTGQKGGPGVGTAPVADGYIAITHPYVGYTLKGLTGFIPVSDYPNPGAAEPGEIGSYRDIRFISTTNARYWADSGAVIGATGYRSTSGVNLDVFSLLVIAADFYGVVPLGDGAVKTVRKPFGWNDLLDRNAAVGARATIAYTILNENLGVRIETCAA